MAMNQATNATSYYATPGSITGGYITDNTLISIGGMGYAYEENDSGDAPRVLSGHIKVKKGIHPELYFKYIRSKFKIIERAKLDKRLETLENAFNKVVDGGQIALGEKILQAITREAKESMAFAKGVTVYIEREDLFRHKRNLRDGHISDTRFKDFTRVIPDKILKRKKELECVFDEFVIFHYWNEKQQDVKKMDKEEKAKMKDPVLFGVIAETDRLYFIAEWKDEFCDLSFEEIVGVIGKNNKHTISSKGVTL